MVQNILEVINGDKHLSFVQFSLRSATSIFQKGGTVTPLLQERVFNMKYDNRRQIIGNINDKPLFYMSKPYNSVELSQINRVQSTSSLGTARFNSTRLCGILSVNNVQKLKTSILEFLFSPNLKLLKTGSFFTNTSLCILPLTVCNLNY